MQNIQDSMNLCCIYGTRAVAENATASVARLLAQLLAGLVRLRSPDWRFELVAPAGSQVNGVTCRVPVLSIPKRLKYRLLKRFCGWSESELWTRKAVAFIAGSPNGIPDTFLCGTGSAPTLLRQRFPKARIVYWLHNLPKSARDTLAAVSASDALVLPSRALYDRLWDRFEADCFPIPVWILRNWVAPEQFAPLANTKRNAERQELGLTPTDLVLAHVGGWAPNKGLRVLVQGLRQCPPPPGRKVVLLTASGATVRTRQTVAAGVDLIEMERLEPSRMNALFNAADVGVAPSVWFENAPLSVLEMMATARPVLAAQAGGIPEMVEHGHTGWLVERPNDVAAWVEALQRLYALSPAELNAMGEAGRQRTLVQFAPAAGVAQWTALLENLARHR